MKPNPDQYILKTDLAGLSLATPVMLAAGTAGVLDEMADVLDLSRVGAVVTKSITPEPREGNETWRVWPLPVGMLNAIGLANPGLEKFIAEQAPRAASVPTSIIASAAGFSIDDYIGVCAAMEPVEAIRAVELNVSCPNVRGGAEFGADPAALSELIRAIRPVLATTRLLVKLPPVAIGVGGVGIVDLARAAIEPTGSKPSGPNQRPGVDVLCLANTIPAMAIDVTTRKPVLANIIGGLSGPAVRPVTLKLVHDVYSGIARDAGIPLVGVGGINSWSHAAEYILAGATAVQIGAALFANPRAPIAITKGLASWASRQNASNISDLVGSLDAN